jgi:sec-independent protein translocase protein TatB
MGGIGFSELLLLALIALLVVGPKRLPEIARTAGQLSRTARNAWQSLKSEFQAELDREHNRRIMAEEPDPESEAPSTSEQTSERQAQESDDDRSERS